MERPHEFKYIKNSLKLINDLNKKKKLRFKKQNLPTDNKEIEIWKSGNHFEFLLKYNSIDISPNFYESVFDTCELLGENKEYSFCKDSVISSSIGFVKPLTTGKLSSIIESNNSIKSLCYYRLIQPVKSSFIGYIEGAIDLRTDHKETITYCGGFNKFNICNLNIDVFRINIDDKEYLIIDSKEKTSYSNFENICDSFYSSYSLIFGIYVGEESYYHSSDNIKYECSNQLIFKSKQKSFIESFPIFSTNNQYEKGLQFFSKKVYERMCENIINDKSYSRTLKIIREGLISPSPLAKCILFSSALETITSLINSSKSQIVPINKERFKKSRLLNTFMRLIKENSSLTSVEKDFLINKKIIHLNSPTNKDKTKETFLHYSVYLPNVLLDILSYRNIYLHGAIPKDEKFGYEIDNLSRAYEIQFLVSILVLKFSGYSGYIQNKSAILEYHAHQKTSDSDNIKLKQAIYYKI